MLQLKNITKSYTTEDFTQVALDGVSISFRDSEFVAILGQSGSGKTTFLNIVGGLDRYDKGDLIINGRSTEKFSDAEWDAYRNNSIGFVFQSYNLIGHLSIVDNVELGMTLSGVPAAEKHKKALEVLDRVGLSDHIHKRPNQLSGGQMQRVAIARALANDPDIILADEPTGALDTTTSSQIMDLIREVAPDKLVIMVTHNPGIAEKYADRIIRFEDGRVVSDSNPPDEREIKSDYKLKRTSMNFFTALSLSFKNIMTKKGRTFLTALASSIGIIGIAVILSLSTGFQTKIDEFQSDAMAEFPVIITRQSVQIDEETMKERQNQYSILKNDTEYANTDEITVYDSSLTQLTHENVLSGEFTDYLEKIDTESCRSIGYARLVNMNLVTEDEDGYSAVSLSAFPASMTSSASSVTSMSNMGLSVYPKVLDDSEGSYLEKNYDLLYGSYPESATDLVLIVDSRNRLDLSTLKGLGVTAEDGDKIKFSDIVGKRYKLIFNDDYYVKTDYGTYLPGTDYEAMYGDPDSLTLTLCGIVRLSEDSGISLLAEGLAYSDDLSQLVIDNAQNSEIVKAQSESSTNVFTMDELTDEMRDLMVETLGGGSRPYMIMLYPKSFEAKDGIIEYLDAYNDGKDADDVILYTDLAATLTSMTSSIMDGITFVLIAFAGISLVVSLIMICIITYTSVLERTKGIGILRALGARKKDITRVFDAETCILGVFSGLLGVFLAWVLTFPINAVIENVSGLANVSQLQLTHALLLVLISTVLTILGGHIPAIIASRKNAVDALRSE